MVCRFLSEYCRNASPRLVPMFASKLSSNGQECHQLWRLGKTWRLCASAFLEHLLGGKQVLIGEGMSAAVLLHRQAWKRTRMTSATPISTTTIRSGVGRVEESVSTGPTYESMGWSGSDRPTTGDSAEPARYPTEPRPSRAKPARYPAQCSVWLVYVMRESEKQSGGYQSITNRTL